RSSVGMPFVTLRVTHLRLGVCVSEAFRRPCSITSNKIKRNIKLIFQYWTIYKSFSDTGDVIANKDGFSATRHRECPDPV
ncbi:hypothetical protein, partial [Pseudomonas syringae]|uniref:hypothetical protein n=2 Tax=Pseudomonas syringae TaxID=317 RepID=UPI00195B226A